MTAAERMQRVGEIFHEAAGREGEEQRRYLLAACGCDAELLREVESLLAADAEEVSLLEGSVWDVLDAGDVEAVLDGGVKRVSAGPNAELEPEAPMKEGRINDERAGAERVEARPVDVRRGGARPVGTSQVRCGQGHYYDSGAHRSCPYCGVRLQGLNLTPEATKRENAGSVVRSARPHIPLSPAADDDAVTRSYVGEEAARELVVGWLVCVSGADRGREFRLCGRRNFLGRDAGMDICISGDRKVSRVNHATLTYDPQGNRFRLAGGSSHGLTYVGGQLVEAPVTLRPHDVIEVGDTKLVFVPLCGEEFRWS